MRRYFRQIVALSALSALAGCDGTQSPLAPPDAGAGVAGEAQGAPAAAEAAPAGAPLAALTNPQILFMSWNLQERADILKIGPQGSGLVNLTNTATSSEYSPAWSYDHK